MENEADFENDCTDHRSSIVEHSAMSEDIFGRQNVGRGAIVSIR